MLLAGWNSTELLSQLVPAGSPGAARPVVLVAMGSLRDSSIGALAEHFRRGFHVRVIVRASVPRPANAYNSLRKQYAGEKLVTHLERICRHGIVTAVTDQDAYMASRPFSCFGARPARGPRLKRSHESTLLRTAS